MKHKEGRCKVNLVEAQERAVKDIGNTRKGGEKQVSGHSAGTPLLKQVVERQIHRGALRGWGGDERI